MKAYRDMTDEELDAAIEERYGKDWRMEDLDPQSDLAAEYWRRVTSGSME